MDGWDGFENSALEVRLLRGDYYNGPIFLEGFEALLRERKSKSNHRLRDELTAALVKSAHQLGLLRSELSERYTRSFQEPVLEMARSGELPLDFLRTLKALEGGGIQIHVQNAFRGPTLEAVVSVLSNTGQAPENVELDNAVEVLSYFEYDGADARRRDGALVGAAQRVVAEYLKVQGNLPPSIIQAVKILAQKAAPNQTTIDALVERSVLVMTQDDIELGTEILEHLEFRAHTDKVYRALAAGFFSPYENSPWSAMGDAILKLSKTAEIPPYIARIILAEVHQYGADRQHAADGYQKIPDVKGILTRRAEMAGGKDDETGRALLDSIIKQHLRHASAQFIPTRPITAYRTLFGQLGNGLSEAVGDTVQRMLIVGDIDEAYALAISAAGRPESVEPAPFREALSRQRNRILTARGRTASEKLYDLREHVSSLVRFETRFSEGLGYGLAEEITATARDVTRRNNLLLLQYLGILADEWVSANGTKPSHAITDTQLRTGLERAFQEGFDTATAFDAQHIGRGLRMHIIGEIQRAQNAFGYHAVMPNTSPATAQRGAYPVALQASQAEAQAPQLPPIAVYIGGKRIPAGSEEECVADVISGLEGKVQTKPEPTQKSFADGGTSMTLHGIVVARDDARVVLTHPALQSAVRAVQVYLLHTGDSVLTELNLEEKRVDGSSILHQRGWNTLAVYQLNGIAQRLTGTQASARPEGRERAGYRQ